MLIRILIVLALSLSFAAAKDAPPSDESVRQLLEVAHARSLVDGMMAQMDGMMKNVMEAATQGEPVSAETQKIFDQSRARIVELMQQEMSWAKLEPMYLRIYKKSLSQEEVNGMIAFYKTPSGQAVINKLPAIMQNTMTEVTQMMGPLTQKVQQLQKDLVAQVQAEKAKKG